MPERDGTKLVPADVQVGQRYNAWGKTWEVTEIWPQRVARIKNVDRPENWLRLPLKQFKTMERA